MDCPLQNYSISGMSKELWDKADACGIEKRKANEAAGKLVTVEMENERLRNALTTTVDVMDANTQRMREYLEVVQYVADTDLTGVEDSVAGRMLPALINMAREVLNDG